MDLQGFLWTYKVFYGNSTPDETNQIAVFVTTMI